MPRTISQLNTLLSPYLGTGAQTIATTTLAMINSIGNQICGMGDWKSLRTPIELNVASGRFGLDPAYECALTASLRGVPVAINDMDIQTKYGWPGKLVRPCGWDVGIIDMGMLPLMQEPPDDGATEFIFTSENGTAFSSGDIVTVTYQDADDGYTQVALPLNTISTSITSAATYESGTETNLAVTSSAGVVVNAGVTISGASVAAYNGDWRVTAVPDGTHIAINKAFVAGAVTGTIATNRRLEPANGITEVEPMVYTSLPSRVTVTDDDETTYAILPAGDGVATFHRYEVPQVPDDPSSPDDWVVNLIVKRAFVQLTGNSDLVWFDNIPALTYAFLAAVARDASDHEREGVLWEKVRKELDKELFNNKGGTKQIPVYNLWGDGMPGLCNLNG